MIATTILVFKLFDLVWVMTRAGKRPGDKHDRGVQRGIQEGSNWNVSIGHAISQDLRTWQVLPDALWPSPASAWDDCTTWTALAKLGFKITIVNRGGPHPVTVDKSLRSEVTHA